MALGLLPAVALAEPKDPEKSAVELITPAATRAIERGLNLLSTRQDEDGSFRSGGYSRNVAICALAGMAFMSGGSTPGRGPYGRNVERCIDFILANTQESGFINVPNASSHGPMYGHGFATLFLAECYGMTMRGDIREKLSKAVQLIVNTQNNEGGWRYQPQRHDADISVTICQIMALRGARNAGLFVPRETIDRCTDYVKRSQNADGGFMYMIQGGQSAFPRSAAGVVALYSAGIYEGAGDQKGARLPDGLRSAGQRVSTRESHYFYGHYYAVQAMWHAGGEFWAKWYPAVRDVAGGPSAGRRLVERLDLPRVRHRHGLHHPANAQQLPADLPALNDSIASASDVARGFLRGDCRRLPSRH